MKTLQDLPLAKHVLATLQMARDRINAEFAVDRIVLFGSVARRRAYEESDVDLLIVLNDSPSHQERDYITSIIIIPGKSFVIMIAVLRSGGGSGVAFDPPSARSSPRRH